MQGESFHRQSKFRDLFAGVMAYQYDWREGGKRQGEGNGAEVGKRQDGVEVGME